jgi:hypothetical protein
MTASPEKIQAALAKSTCFETFSKHLLADALGWPMPDKVDDPEDLTFDWAESDLRAKGLERWLAGGRVLQLQSLVRNQRWGIFIVEFAQDVFTAGRGMTGPLRQVLRGLVTSARSTKRAANLPSWSRQDLLFICTYQWKHYAVARFSEPAEKGRVPRLATFGWSAEAASRTRTVVTQNLPHLEWPDEVADIEGWRTAWSHAWDKEALTKDFFRVFAGDPKRGLPGVFHVLRENIAKLNKVSDEVAAQKALLILNRMMFLYFIQRKGWLAQDQDFLRKAFRNFEDRPDDTDFFAEKARAKPYTSGFLSGLFMRLATDADTDPRFSAVPFLNGGLFEPDEVDADLKISNRTFRVVFDELLDRYNFTVTEDTPLDVEVAIDPEMLGKIFECLVLQSEMDKGILAEDGKKPKDKRKLTGSYYTPRAIVHFMCQEALKEHLRSHAPDAAPTALDVVFSAPTADLIEDAALAELRAAVPADLARAWSEALKNLKACDPAVGSGAFVVGMLHEVVRVRSVLDRILSKGNPSSAPNYFYNLKHEVIKHSLYGVDIQEQAVRLCELRLWLSLVVDYDLWKGAPESQRTPEEFRRRLHSDLPALPNLSYLIVRGDSLLEWLHGDVIPLQRRAHDKAMTHFFHDQRTKDTIKSLGDAKRAYFQSHDATQKHQLAAAILDYKASLVERLLEAMLVRATQGTNKDQDLFADGETAAQRKQRQEEEALRSRYVDALAKVKAARKQLAAHRQEIADPNAASLHELESEIFGDTTDHPAFFWRLDFAEVFAERGGFDIVIANPPYIRMELIKEITPHLKKYYRAAAGRADAYIYFFEQGVGLLRDGGALVYISSSTFAKTGSGKALRTILRDETTLRRFVDFDLLQVFEGVTTLTGILLLRRGKPTDGNTVQGTVIQTLDPDALDRELRAPGVIVRQKELKSDGWRFEDRRLARLRQKIKDAGVPLKEHCGSPLYGIKTGLNDAFVIDSATRDALVAQDKRSAEILKPFLEGKDLKPWRAEWRGLWLIYTHHGIDMKPYPAVLEHLRTYKKRLEARATAHLHPWWELQQPQFEYSKAMAAAKIIYPHFSRLSKFSFDSGGFYSNDKTYLIPSEDLALLGILNSSVSWCHISGVCQVKLGRVYELRVMYMETIPIARPSATDRKKLSDLAEALSAESCPNRLALEAELNDRVAHLYGLTAEEQKIVNGILPAAKDDGGDGEEE